ncbi:X-linked retinitis pigmentosa GTPase regulator-like [Hyalella azteca]|uniref:X-linked retinitis pigmentosa GTPase regulator-like n=1 Tax=Hyalella azteca TaxID=294128 RepID=A0A979FIY3_HYAAZ|nr:X-linked retinitis pigmentosa GTPase regulator-like [Hyalella azteca]
MTVEDELEIPKGGAVFTFGKSRFADNAPSKFWIKNDEIAGISCGDEHTAVLTALKPHRVVLVACGRAHTIAATETGGIYSWGHNDEGQLGTGDTEDRDTPQLVLSLHAPPAAIAAGSAHSVLVTAVGALLTFGEAADGKLGREIQQSLQTPQQVPGLVQRASRVAAGGKHSLILTGGSWEVGRG